MRPFLKWPGGKYRISTTIRARLQPGQRLIEPFTGSGAVFLNTDYRQYLLADSNGDLINLYRHLVSEGEEFISRCRQLFQAKNNNERAFYRLRNEFNKCTDSRRKSVLFLYLNRHCYNGLIRYNASGEFNTPFGRYVKPYFPEKEMRHFIGAAQKAEFLHAGFRESMGLAQRGDMVYCDPPYAPLGRTAYFTDYHPGGFKWMQQEQLAQLARGLADRGIPVVISNHDTPEIRHLYKNSGASIVKFQVRRSISRDAGNRRKVGELLALFT